MRGEADEELEGFVRGRSAALLRYGYVLTGSPHDAADLAQEALARLGVAWPRVRHRGDPEAYVRTTMVRLHISWMSYPWLAATRDPCPTRTGSASPTTASRYGWSAR